MKPVAVLFFYPLWAVALGVAAIALRLGRDVGRGLVALCLCLALWVLGLILAHHPQTQPWADRLIPSGMLLAGGFIHAFVDVAKLEHQRRYVLWGWAYGALIAGWGLVAPHTLFDVTTSARGPAFIPLAIVSTAGTMWVSGWMLRHTLAVAGVERRRRAVLLLANVLGALGGGGTMLLATWNIAPLSVAAPFLLGAIGLATWSVLADETGRHAEFLRLGLWYALVTAALSAVGLSVFFRLLPQLVPLAPERETWLYLLWVCFVAALPIDPLRQWLVEGFMNRVFKKSLAVKSLAHELEATEHRAVHAEQLAALGRVASVVAHEVRNPLGVILAQAKMLEREGVSSERLADVRAQISRASRFVDELLRYAKPREFTLTRVDLKAAAERAIDHVRKALKTSVAMHSPAQAETIEADAQAVVDALVILLSNAAIALESTPDARIDVLVQPRAGAVTLVVEDNGPGVPPELESRLFELFATGRGRDHPHPGVGLGLAIARQHALRHGGRLSYERRVPHGARFILRFPTS